MPKKTYRHNAANLAKLPRSSQTTVVQISKSRSSRDLASLRVNSRDGPYMRPSLKVNCYLKDSKAALEPDDEADKL